MGTPSKVRRGPGLLYAAPLATTDPSDLATPLPSAWIAVGYTDTGTEFSFETAFADVEVAEELEPIDVAPTGRTDRVSFAMAELSVVNLKLAMNGGSSATVSGVTSFESPEPSDMTAVKLVWEDDYGFERWLFRKALQVGNVTIPRRKGAEKAVIPVEFRLLKPSGVRPYKAFIDDDFS